MQSANSKQNIGSNKLPKVLVLSLTSCDTSSGGNEIHPILVPAWVLYNLRGKRWWEKVRWVMEAASFL